ncbi:tetratricopeptide repeat protein [Kitasatospora sp. NPDC057542]|uniref:tetratricopeptide repeat protein n=1 Tax=Kitasatospora sp. NPDC057542 TaxID=3346162 RepID=UPI00369C4848
MRTLDGERPLAHTVLWLNESQRFLALPGGGAVAEAVTALLLDPGRGPVLVLGTLWRDTFATLTAEKDDSVRSPTAALLNSAAVIGVPESFDPAALTALRLLAHQDPRLVEAIEQGGARITQYLAGSQELVHRYETAPHEARALMNAAADARRLGHPEALPEHFLRAAGAAYLDLSHWLQQTDEWRSTWFERAVQYTSRACRGVPGPLVREVPPPGRPSSPNRHYLLADYLLSYTQRSGVRRLSFPPQGFWDAAETHLSDNGAVLALARAADTRFRYRIAEQLAHKAAETGDTGVLAALAESRANMGRPGADRLARAAEDRGDPSVAAELAERDAGSDQWDAEQRLSDTILSGVLAMGDLAEQQVRAGRWEDAEQLGLALATVGEIGVLRIVAESMADAGRWQEAERLAHASRDPYFLSRLAGRRAEEGHWEDAERLARAADQGGRTDAFAILAAMRAEDERWDEAERLAHEAAAAGNTRALSALSRCAADEGKWTYAEALAHKAADPFALAALSWRRAGEGSWEEAERLAGVAAEAGTQSAFDSLAKMRARAGEWEEAERLAHAAGGGKALVYIVRRLAGLGQWQHAQRLAHAAVDAGTAEGLAWLAVLSANAGRTEEADRLWLLTVNAGLPWTIYDFMKVCPVRPDGLDAEGRPVENP